LPIRFADLASRGTAEFAFWAVGVREGFGSAPDQAGNSTFPEFLLASWRAGVVRYEVELTARTVTYHGCRGEAYVEQYPACELK
jgi:hypothetical protein